MSRTERREQAHETREQKSRWVRSVGGRVVIIGSIAILPITSRTIHMMTQMPHHHKDPFDRIIAATALVEGIPLLSVDSIFDRYGVPRIWLPPE